MTPNEEPTTPALREAHEAEAYLATDGVRCRVCRRKLRVIHRHPSEGDCYGH